MTPSAPLPGAHSLSPRWTLALTALLLFALVVSVLIPLPLDFFANSTRVLSPTGDRISVGIDFNLRYNEISCLREGTDPFLVRNGIVQSERYDYFLRPATIPPKRGVDAYTPWGYTAFYWITFLPEPISWTVYYIIMTIAFGALPVFGVWLARLAGLSGLRATLVSLAVFFVSFPITAGFYTGNYSILMPVALAFLLWALQRGYDATAAVAWAFLMIKPQCATLLAAPLLLHQKWKTCLIAGSICLSAAVLASLLCDSSVWALVMEIPKFGIEATSQTKFIPGILMNGLAPIVPLTVSKTVSMFLGISLCTFLSWKLRKSPIWAIRLLPAIVLGAYWTYAAPHNDCTLGIAQAVFCAIILLPATSRVRWPAAICFFTVPLLHVHRLFSIENVPWTIWRILGLSFPDSSLVVRLLSVIHLFANWILLSAFVIFCLRFAKYISISTTSPFLSPLPTGQSSAAHFLHDSNGILS